MANKSTIGETASRITQQELGAQLAAATRLTPAEIGALFPAPADQAELLALVNAVKEAADENEARAVVTARIGDFAKVLVKVVKHLAI